MWIGMLLPQTKWRAKPKIKLANEDAPPILTFYQPINQQNKTSFPCCDSQRFLDQLQLYYMFHQH